MRRSPPAHDLVLLSDQQGTFETAAYSLQRFIDAFLDEDPTFQTSRNRMLGHPSRSWQQMAVLQPPTGPVPHDTVGLRKMWIPTLGWGARGQAALLRDVHASLLRLLEGHEEELLELATLPGYGPAADLAPSDAYRPLLGLSWPALVHNALQQHAASITQPTAIAAVAQLTGTCYEQLGGRQRLAILEALLAIVADTEAVRGHMLATATAAQEQDEQGQTAPDKHMGLLGSDAAGVRYYLLAGDVGRRMLFVEDDIFEAFQPLLQPASHPQALNPTDAAASLGQLQGVWPRHATAEEKQLEAEAVPGLLADPGDGYRAVQNPVDWGLLLRQDLLDRLNSTRWWDKPLDWLQARAAVEKLVQAAETGPQLGRLIWLIEELTYDDLLKGTGWGRRRSPFREQLEQCRTLHQAAVLSGQLAIHCRSAHEMGHISRDDHVAAARQLRCPLPATPAIGQAVYVLRTAYEDHLRNTGFPDDPTPPRPPPEWGSLMRCTAAQVCHLRTAHPPRLSATGRPVSQPLGPHGETGEMGEDGDMSGGSDEDEDIGGKRMTTRSRRPRNQDHFMLNAGNVAVAQAAKAAMAAGQTLPPLGFRLQAGEEEAVRWWVRPRAYGVATVRSSHTPGFQPLPFLFPAEIIETGWDQRIWKAGTPVKMPADGTPIHQAMVQPQVVHWYSGVLQNTFVPLVAPGQTVPDPCRALRIAWDEDTPAPIARLPGFHPWQVAVDEGGLLRGHKQRLKAEALMRCQADIRARNEAAMKRAAEREAAAESLRMASQARAEAARQQYLQQQASQRPGSQPSTLPPQVGLQQHMHGQAPALPGHLQRPHGLPEQPSEASPSHKQLTASQLPTAASQQQPAGPQGTPQQPYGPQQDAASATLRSMGLQQSSMNGPPALTSLPEAQQAVPGSYSALLTDQDPLPGSPAQQAMAGATSGEDGAAKARPRKRKGREGDEGEGKEPRAGRVRKAQKGPSEGYRDRWLARKPRPNPTTWCSAACSACEKGGPGLLVCMGPCL
ncbi:hypothetical protein WJX84_003514, partial [Apatococcus fuscideae]